MRVFVIFFLVAFVTCGILGQDTILVQTKVGQTWQSQAQSRLDGHDTTIDSLFNILPKYAVDASDFGVVGDGVTDNIIMLQRAIDSLEDYLNAAGFANGGKLQLPSGKYKVSEPLKIYRAMEIVGEGTFSTPNTIILVPADSNGIIINEEDGQKPTVVKLTNIRIEEEAGGTDTCYGVYAKRPVILSGSRVVGFHHGVYIEAGVSAGGGNANNSRIQGNHISHSRSDGLKVVGSDANNLRVLYNDFSNNGGYGVNHQSLFNSTYLGNHFSYNSSGAFYDPVGSSEFIGTYVELANGNVYTNGAIRGGTFPVRPLAADSSAGVNYLTNTGSFYNIFTVDVGNNIVSIGDNDVTDAIEVIKLTSAGGHQVTMYLDTTTNRITFPAAEFTSTNVEMTYGFYVGGYGNAAINPAFSGFTYSGFLPNPTEYNIGDYWRYKDPIAGGKVGVVVVDSSGVNVLREYGDINP